VNRPADWKSKGHLIGATGVSQHVLAATTGARARWFPMPPPASSTWRTRRRQLREHPGTAAMNDLLTLHTLAGAPAKHAARPAVVARTI
jgi:hypothetical protein